MATPLVQLSDIHLTFGGTPLLEGADLSVAPGERVALVGRNGSGKSTLLRIAAGLVEPDAGQVFVQPGAALRVLAQEPDFAGFATALDYVEAGLGPTDDPYRARQLLDDLGLAADADPATLSGGEARRAALAQVLVASPDILLLDEPTNHLDLPTIEWLEAKLSETRAALVLISHDRRFLERLSTATVWLDRGRSRRLEQGFAHYEEWRDRVLAEEELAQHKLDRKIVAEEHWVRYGVTARRKRNVRRMAELEELRRRRREHRASQGRATLATTSAEASGALVIEAKGIAKSFDGRAIVAGLDLRVMRGDRLAVAGPNGSGKTTLVGMLTGALTPDAGSVRQGTNLETAILEQDRDSLDPETTLADALTGGRGDSVVIGGRARHVMSYLKEFLFTSEQGRSPLRVLSGGERARLMLARALAKPSNLLVLDEPTNDLDLETLDVLEELLASYPGTVILISHDRAFLDRIATSVLAPEGGGRWVEYAGGYTDMLAQRGADLAARSPSPAPGERSRPAAAAPEPQEPRQPKRKLAFHEKHALETLPARIAALEGEVAGHRAKLDDPTLYARDPKAFAAASSALAVSEAALVEAEERWLELELLREELGRA